MRRSSSKKDKENGQKGGGRGRSGGADVKANQGAQVDYIQSPRRRPQVSELPHTPVTTTGICDIDCTETDVHRAHTSHIYKPRI